MLYQSAYTAMRNSGTHTCGTMISPLTNMRSSTLTRAHSRRLSLRALDAPLLPPTPNSAPTFRQRSKNNQTGSPFLTLTVPAGMLVPSKNIKGINISVFFTASCMARNSLRSASRASASAFNAAFVIAFGGGGAFGFGVMRRDEGAELSSAGVLEAERGILESRGVAATSAVLSFSSSSSSSPNESLLLVIGFFFFFFGGPSLRGVELLYALRSVTSRDFLEMRFNLPVSHFTSRRSCTSGGESS